MVCTITPLICFNLILPNKTNIHSVRGEWVMAYWPGSSVVGWWGCILLMFYWRLALRSRAGMWDQGVHWLQWRLLDLFEIGSKWQHWQQQWGIQKHSKFLTNLKYGKPGTWFCSLSKIPRGIFGHSLLFCFEPCSWTLGCFGLETWISRVKSV